MRIKYDIKGIAEFLPQKLSDINIYTRVARADDRQPMDDDEYHSPLGTTVMSQAVPSLPLPSSGNQENDEAIVLMAMPG